MAAKNIINIQVRVTYSESCNHWARLASIGLTRHLRGDASAAISAEQYDALRWLEQGRFIVWNQLLHLHIPVDALRDVEPGFADGVRCVARALEPCK